MAPTGEDNLLNRILYRRIRVHNVHFYFRLRVIAREALRGEIEGMCGDFDDDRSNDLIHGVTGEVVTDIDEFVHSWRASGYGVQ